MIVTRGALVSNMITYLFNKINVRGTVTNRTVQALVPGNVSAINIMAWQQAEQQIKINRHHTTAFCLEVAVAIILSTSSYS